MDSQTRGLFDWVGAGKRQMEILERRGSGVRQTEGLGCRHRY